MYESMIDKGITDNLPGRGGVYNSLNLGLYTYTHQNPLVLVDPDGKETKIALFNSIGEFSGWKWKHLGFATGRDNTLGERTQTRGWMGTGAWWGKEGFIGNESMDLQLKSFIINTSPEQEIIINEVFAKAEKNKEEFNFFNNSCVQVLDRALEEAGLDTPYAFTPEMYYNKLEKIYPNGKIDISKPVPQPSNKLLKNTKE